MINWFQVLLLKSDYINNKVDYLKIYSKKIGFIFNNNVAMEPYSKGLFPPESITQSASFRVGRPNTLVIADMMNHVKHEYYNEHNLGKRITEEACMLAKNQCFDVLFYEKILHETHEDVDEKSLFLL